MLVMLLQDCSMAEASLIEINADNLAQEHICCAIGNDATNTARANTKKKWLQARFKDGLVFKRLEGRGKFFVEYLPIEKAWKPVQGKDALLIHCLWVAGSAKGKGTGKRLLEDVIQAARRQKLGGVAVVTAKRKSPFLTDASFFKKYGFEVVDTAPPAYELLFLSLRKNSQPPAFTSAARTGRYKYKSDFTLVYSHQCPFTEEYVHLMAEIIKQRKKKVEIIQLKSAAQARKYGAPFGTFSLFYQGQLLGHELMAEKKLQQTLDQVLA